MKKLATLLLPLMLLISLAGCGKSINGTYVRQEAGAKGTITISDNKHVHYQLDSLLGKYDFEGQLNPSQKTMFLEGNVWGNAVSQECPYELTDDGDLLIKAEESEAKISGLFKRQAN
ncbi:hypothetical protein ACVRY7_01620 [Streptococcus ictaluri]|uniref:Lipoprotein n=1 Tax=Streptococcus ictaluri 707-05 TaxID=764299 RepID=G5JZJ3_9STRE|nr:hypothetical protein [Streptococcus ictaluri]EHI70811.1 hypothetical protein STRIC_0705 [Streptococcus ictaluri 707-05]